VSMPFTATIGRARVIEIHDPESIKPEELPPHRIQRGERILFKTRKVNVRLLCQMFPSLGCS
jgi:hypothetical protein